MNVTRKWKRIVAVGCTHGEFLNQDAAKAVFRFCKTFKPEIRVHLGDAYDTRAFRSGAKGTQDETAPMADDIGLGGRFLYEFKPTHFAEGNHDYRPRQLMNHHNTIISEAAAAVHQRMMEPLVRMKTLWKPWSIWHAHEIGGFKFWHGVLYGENYLRDTANRWGNCVVAHAHRAGYSKAIRTDCGGAFGVGTLATIEAMGYAEHRASTLAWSHGIVWGEVCEDKANLQLTQWPKGEAEWRLPI